MCEALTRKGLPCKNYPLKGGRFCRVHTKNKQAGILIPEEKLAQISDEFKAGFEYGGRDYIIETKEYHEKLVELSTWSPAYSNYKKDVENRIENIKKNNNMKINALENRFENLKIKNKELKNGMKMKECENKSLKNKIKVGTAELNETNMKLEWFRNKTSILKECSIIDDYINEVVQRETGVERNWIRGVKNNIHDLFKLNNVVEIIRRDFGVSPREFKRVHDRLREERNKVAHPHLDMSKSKKIRKIKELIENVSH